jgi:hypothetical protein
MRYNGLYKIDISLEEGCEMPNNTNITCDFDYCLHNEKSKCSFSTVTINSLGMCDDAIMLHLKPKFLEAEKKRQLKGLDDRQERRLLGGLMKQASEII